MTQIAVIGAGYWGPNLIRNFQPRCEQVWVCDRDPARLEAMGRRFPGVRPVSDVEEVLAAPEVDAVVIATPIGTHFELAERALAAGKHVFVEKPLATRVEEAAALVERAARAGRVLMVGHTFEYSPAVVRIRELVRGGALGDVCFVSSMRVNLGLHQKDVSVIWDLAPHDVSMLHTWIDELPTTVSATGRAFVGAQPDVAFISLVYASGIIAHLEVSWLAPSKLRRTTIVGTEKMLVYDDTESVEKVKLYDRGVDFRDPETFGEFQLSYRTGDILSPALPSFEPLALEAEELLRAVNGGRAPRADGASGLRVVQVLAAAQRSLESGGVPVALDAEPEKTASGGPVAGGTS